MVFFLLIGNTQEKNEAQMCQKECGLFLYEECLIR